MLDPQNHNLCLAGGVFANVKLNKRVHEMGFKNIFVQPAMSDAGLATGAALGHLGLEHGLRPYKLKDVYGGPGYTNAEAEAAIRAAGLKYEIVEPIEPKIAELLAQSFVVARFEGRVEFGPRALGHRSILYMARDPQVNTWLNKRLQRTEFMPFAPSTLYEAAEQCFEGVSGAHHSAQFMTITFDCTPFFKEHCPAAVHVDGTARPSSCARTRRPRTTGSSTSSARSPAYPPSSTRRSTCTRSRSCCRRRTRCVPSWRATSTTWPSRTVSNPNLTCHRAACHPGHP